MNKLIVLSVFAFFVFTSSQAQMAEWGIKGGLNYNSNGDLITEGGAIIDDPESNAGFHIGVFAQTKGGIFIRPELVYTQTKSSYSEGDFKMSSLDMPILAGFKILGPLNIFAGPAFRFILDSDLDNYKLTDLEKDFTVGGVIGIGVQLGKIGVDVRYERGFTDNEVGFFNIDKIGTIDTRQKQLIASVSFKF